MGKMWKAVSADEKKVRAWTCACMDHHTASLPAALVFLSFYLLLLDAPLPSITGIASGIRGAGEGGQGQVRGGEGRLRQEEGGKWLSWSVLPSIQPSIQPIECHA